MNIGIVLYPTYGGSGVMATELGKSLANKGHKVHFITYSHPVRLDGVHENITYHEVRVSDYPLFDYQPYETVLASKMVDVVKYDKLDVLHVHYAIPHASAALMARQILASEGIYVPFVTTLHGTDITLVGRSPSFEPVISYCLNESDAITAVSESLKQDTYEHFKTDREINVIPNFVKCLGNLNDDNSAVRARYANEDELILCHISNFRKVKRVGDVLEVFARVNANKPGKLLFVGDGPERYAMEQKCRDMDLCDRVIFLGKIRDTDQVLKISDLFLLPSETESFGLAALEAMAVGVPVISSNTGGIPEVNNHGETGFLSNVGDLEDMANNALKILSSPDIMKGFKERALRRANEFSVESVLEQYVALYEDVVKQKSPRKTAGIL